jgi:hypothetical protein
MLDQRVRTQGPFFLMKGVCIESVGQDSLRCIILSLIELDEEHRILVFVCEVEQVGHLFSS